MQGARDLATREFITAQQNLFLGQHKIKSGLLLCHLLSKSLISASGDSAHDKENNSNANNPNAQRERICHQVCTDITNRHAQSNGYGGTDEHECHIRPHAYTKAPLPEHTYLQRECTDDADTDASSRPFG